MRRHFTIGGYDYRKTARFRQSIHFRFDARESTTISRSSGFRVDAGRHLFSESEKNVALSCSFEFRTLMASLDAASRATCSCHCLLLRPALTCWSVVATLMRFSWASHSERRVLVSSVCITCNGFREFYTSDRFPHV